MQARQVRLILAVFLSVSTLPTAPRIARAGEDPLFIRGDVDGSGSVDLRDALDILEWLFLGPEGGIPCLDAADADDGGAVDLTDGILLLSTIFRGGPGPAAPFPGCGADGTPDSLTCAGSFICVEDGFVDDGQGGVLAATVPGLESRPPSGACVALPRPQGQSSLAIARAYPSLPVTGIVGMYQPPGDSSRWYIVRRKGFIYSFENSSSVRTKGTVLDFSTRIPEPLPSEGGLLSMAFHPGFRSNGLVYIFYTGPGAGGATMAHISRFSSRDGGSTIDSGSEVRLLAVEQGGEIHHGGSLGFGPDGYLYIGLGDSTRDREAQDTGRLLGSMLRIDVNSGSPYGIPPDNPYASGGGRPEVFAKGLRQPWRWSFDRVTGDLWLGDVGHNSFEEVNRIEKGKNYGWPILEGASCHNGSSCNTSGLTAPVVSYPHAEGTCVIGGFVYRGSAIPGLDGVYVYGDWGSNKVWGLFPDGSGGYARRLLLDAGFNIISFAQGEDGEIYLIEGVALHKLVPGQGGSPGGTFPALLSQTGYVNPSNPRLPSPCMIPYDINVPFWSDGAAKERWFSIPDGTRIHIEDDGDWAFPIGTVFMKNFHLGGKIIETRLFMRHQDGNWAGYSYEWNESETDATLLADVKTKTIGSTPWTYPSGSQCLACHTEAAGRALGPETAQMNRGFTYLATGRTANQVTTYAHIGLFDAPLPVSPEDLPAMPRPTDSTKPIGARARAYLHSNCSHCHRPGGTGRGPADFRFTTPLSDMGICNAVPTLGTLGVPDALLVYPGEPSRSIVTLRMHLADENRMPPIARNLVDTAGAAVVDQWIASLSGCGDDPVAETVIQDNGPVGTVSAGTWAGSGALRPFGPVSVFSREAGSYSFHTALTAPGEYEVFLWWTEWPTRMTAIPVEVGHIGGTTTVTVNQQSNGGRWNSIGRWSFEKQARITLRSPGQGSTCADAVKLEPVTGGGAVR